MSKQSRLSKLANLASKSILSKAAKVTMLENCKDCTQRIYCIPFLVFFLLFSPLFLPEILKRDYFVKYLDVQTSSLKICFFFAENWWRIYLSKLTTSNPVSVTFAQCIGNNCQRWLIVSKISKNNRSRHNFFWGTSQCTIG